MGKQVGRPVQAKTVRDYFSSGSGRQLWKEGVSEKENVGNGSGEFDDGKYRVKLVKAYTAMSNNSGKPQNVMAFKFLEGEYKGQTVYAYQGLDNKIGLGIALATIKKLGFDVDDVEELDKIDGKLTKKGPEVELRIQTRGEYQNKIVVKLLSDEDEEDKDVDVEEDEDAEPAKKGKSKAADDEDDDKVKDSGSEDADEDADGDNDDDEDEDKKDTKKSDEDEDSYDEDEEEDEKPSKKAKKSDDEAEEDEEDEDEDEKKKDEDEVVLDIGKRISFKYDGEKTKGKIIKVNEEAREVKVKLADGTKLVVSVDDIIDVL